MTNRTTVEELRQFFVYDKVCLWYNGDFNDDFTERIIFLSEGDLNKKSRKRMSFLVAESYQNIIRHGNEQIETTTSTVFGVRRIDPYLHVFSSNVVDAETKEYLTSELKSLEGLSKEELKEMYKASLSEGGLSDKGGAGLGLIEMARKSTRPLQYGFEENEEKNYDFTLQLDLLLDGQEGGEEPKIQIDNNEWLHKYVEEKQIIFLLKSDFTDELTTPLLKMLKGNTSDAMGKTGKMIYHAAVEMIQNIVRHTKVMNDRREGVFCLMNAEHGYTLCSGNYINDDSDVQEWIEELNSMNKDELNAIYRERLLNGVPSRGNNSAGIGMIDVRRKTLEPIHINISQQERGQFLGMYIDIVVE